MHVLFQFYFWLLLVASSGLRTSYRTGKIYSRSTFKTCSSSSSLMIDDSKDSAIILFRGSLRLLREMSPVKRNISFILLETAFDVESELYTSVQRMLKTSVEATDDQLQIFSGTSYEDAMNAMLVKMTSKTTFYYYESNIDPIRTISKTIARRLSENGRIGIQIQDFNDKSSKELLFSQFRLNKVTRNEEFFDIDNSENLASIILRDYMLLGETAFSNKYAELYISQICRSADHERSFRRLLRYDSRGSLVSTNFFQGEVLSGLLAPLVELGCVVPRELLAARRSGIYQERPIFCRLKAEAIRKYWHFYLASNPAKQSPSWNFSNRFWRGFLQRDAVMLSHDDGSFSTSKPAIVLIHGFGGSIEQFSGLGERLRSSFNVFALDSIGFGRSEKPPLSYNQYLWRDQVMDFIDDVVYSAYADQQRSSSKEVRVDVVVAGNSIGGFTATSVAAAMAERVRVTSSADDRNARNIHCAGLVLFNPSGKIEPPTASKTADIKGSGSEGASADDGDEYFPPYRGPAPEFLRLFGRGVVSLLQPRIRQTCEWLYPSRPEHVQQSGLADTILRDSGDPGAPDIIAAGGKLPRPRSVNDLLSRYHGPVLLCQGALDPLNNATSRAEAFQSIRPGISVSLLPLGHCPMDENPDLVAESIRPWAESAGILSRQTVPS